MCVSNIALLPAHSYDHLTLIKSLRIPNDPREQQRVVTIRKRAERTQTTKIWRPVSKPRTEHFGVSLYGSKSRLTANQGDGTLPLS
jgi:hypothetical protein